MALSSQHDRFVHGNEVRADLERVSMLDSRSIQSSDLAAFQEDISDYVAQLQLHMALQARNLVPTLTPTPTGDSRQQLLHQTQAMVEKLVSRQAV